MLKRCGPLRKDLHVCYEMASWYVSEGHLDLQIGGKCLTVFIAQLVFLVKLAISVRDVS